MLEFSAKPERGFVIAKQPPAGPEWRSRVSKEDGLYVVRFRGEVVGLVSTLEAAHYAGFRHAQHVANEWISAVVLRRAKDVLRVSIP